MDRLLESKPLMPGAEDTVDSGVDEWSTYHAIPLNCMLKTKGHTIIEVPS